MNDFNIVAKSQDERDKVNIDLAGSSITYKERLNVPVIAEQVIREQQEHFRESRSLLPRGRAYSSRAPVTRAISRWQSRTRRSNHRQIGVPNRAATEISLIAPELHRLLVVAIILASMMVFSMKGRCQ